MRKYTYNTLNSGGGIIVTYKCSAACMHCCYASSPKRSGQYMTAETADKIFKGLKKMSCYSVHIGGGETFMNFEKLLDVCITAKKNMMTVDYVETNASWAVNKEKTIEMLRELASVDIDCLLISVDPFHNEFIPFDRVQLLIDCCKKTKMSYFIWQERYLKNIIKLDRSKTHTLEEYNQNFGEDAVVNASLNYGMNYNGRAILLSNVIHPKKKAEYFLNRSDKYCNITSTNHFHIDLYENFIPPSCMGIQINFDDILEDKITDEKYKNYLSIAEDGISALYETAVNLGFTEYEKGYPSKCALCFDLKKFILEKSNSDNLCSVDIGPKEFFSENYFT